MKENRPFNSEINTAKEACEKAKEAAKKTQDYINKTNKLIKQGITVSDIQKLVNNLDGIGKLTFVFGAISAGLELAIMLSGQPSPEEQIMKMIDGVSRQISELKKQMDKQFERMRDFVQLSNRNTQISVAIGKIETIKKMIETYREYKAEPDSEKTQEKIAYAERLLLDDLENKRTQVRTAVSEIASLLTTVLVDKTYFESLNDYTYGDYRRINAIGNCCISYIISALQIDGVLSGLKNRDTADDKDQLTAIILDESGKYYSTYLTTISELISDALTFASNEDNANYYAKKYVDEKLIPEMPLDKNLSLGSLQNSAKLTAEKLTEQWPWCRWYSIVYHPLHTFNHHGVSEAWKIDFRVETKQEYKFNLIVHRIPNTNPYPGQMDLDWYMYKASTLAETVFSPRDRGLDFKKALNHFETAVKNGEFPKHSVLWLSKADSSDGQSNFGLGSSYYIQFPSRKQHWDSYYEYYHYPNSALAV